jgi:hypothetical protein
MTPVSDGSFVAMLTTPRGRTLRLHPKCVRKSPMVGEKKRHDR